METAVQPAMEAVAVVSAETADPLKDLEWLPCRVSLEIPVVKFTVGDLLRLSKGSIVETSSPITADIPILANGQLIGQAEFEVVGDRLAVRVTELA